MPKVNWSEFKAGQEYWLYPSKVELDKINQELINEANRQKLKDLHKQVVDSHFEDAMRYFMTSVNMVDQGMEPKQTEEPKKVPLDQTKRDRFLDALDKMNLGTKEFITILQEQDVLIDNQKSTIDSLRMTLRSIGVIVQDKEISNIIGNALVATNPENQK